MPHHLCLVAAVYLAVSHRSPVAVSSVSHESPVAVSSVSRKHKLLVNSAVGMN